MTLINSEFDFSDIVKTPEEIAIEDRHEWIKFDAPICCFMNCFKREVAMDKHNWKEIFPEYYWLNQRKRTIERNIKQQKYKDNNELRMLENNLRHIKQLISETMNPNLIKSHQPTINDINHDGE